MSIRASFSCRQDGTDPQNRLGRCPGRRVFLWADLPTTPLPTRLDSNIPENSWKVPGGSHYWSKTPNGTAFWLGRRGRARSALATVTRVYCVWPLPREPMVWLSVGRGRGGWEKVVMNLNAATENPCLAMCTCFAIGPAKWRCMSSELNPRVGMLWFLTDRLATPL